MSESEQESTQKALRLPLGLLQAFVGLTTSGGGILLMVDPSGELLDLRVEWLYETPFNDYAAPGIVKHH